MQETYRKGPNARIEKTLKLLSRLHKIQRNKHAALSIESLANPSRNSVQIAPFRNANRKKLRPLLVSDLKQILKALGGEQCSRLASSRQQGIGSSRCA
jgi:hypothetical protein